MTTVASGTDPGFRRYLAARVISMAGTLITAVVLPVLVYRLTGSAAWTAAVVAAEALPHLLLAPFAAPIVARRDVRNVLLTADLASAALLVSIPLAWGFGGLSGWQVLAVAGVLQAVFVMREAADAGAFPVPVDTTAGRGATGLVELMVPPLAGLAVAIVAPAPLLILDAVSFLASALLVRAAVRTWFDRKSSIPAEPTSLPRHRMRSGLRFLRGNPRSRTWALAGTLHAAAGGAYLAMLLPWADQHLGVPPSGDARLALLISCWGLGAMIACALYPALTRRAGPVRLAREGLLVALASGLGALASGHWLPAVVAGLLWGAAHTVASKAAMNAVETPGRAVARLLWRGAGPLTGAALAAGVAMLGTPRAGLAVGIGVLALAELTARRGDDPDRGPSSEYHGILTAGRRRVAGPRGGRSARCATLQKDLSRGTAAGSHPPEAGSR
ncbi:MAG: MFS transporter [Pseudonocardiaceae bacterium]